VRIRLCRRLPSHWMSPTGTSSSSICRRASCRREVRCRLTSTIKKAKRVSMRRRLCHGRRGKGRLMFKAVPLTRAACWGGRAAKIPGGVPTAGRVLKESGNSTGRHHRNRAGTFSKYHHLVPRPPRLPFVSSRLSEARHVTEKPAFRAGFFYWLLALRSEMALLALSFHSCSDAV
jgi:hypothetical protein